MSIVIPAGTYILGDPCYFNRSIWDELLQDSGFFEEPVATSLTGTRVVAFPTMFGDGEYRDQYGNTYPVDAGLIGVTPFDPAIHKDTSGGNVVTWEKDVVAYERNGLIVFGEFQIETNQTWDDDDDCDSDEEE